jgi:D-arabinose 1-dehydrogenase-like Zn-dependent alcohol dehydrogenase
VLYDASVARFGDARAAVALLALILVLAFRSVRVFFCVMVPLLCGTLSIVGLPVEPLTFEAGNLVGEARTIVGAKLAGIDATQEMLDFCAEHGIVADVEVIDIADINEAWQRVKDSDVRYRFVIDVAGSLRG